MKWCFALVMGLWLALVPGLRAQGTDDQYVHIYNLIQTADSLSDGGHYSAALSKYLEAETDLQRFQRANPDWNVQVVKFRLGYLADKVAALSAKVPGFSREAATRPGTGPAKPAVTAGPSDWENQLAALRDQVRELQSEKSVLESKLKEALSAQPATLDPRELARAQARIKALQRENDLLHVRLAEEKAKPAGGIDPKTLALAQQALAEANRKLADQTHRADSLAQEKQFLQSKLAVLAPTQENAAAFAATRKELAEANSKLAQQTQLAARLATEKEALQSRVKALSEDSGAVAALRAENQLIKKQLAEAKAAPSRGGGGDAARQLAQAQAQIAALESDKEILHLEKMALEGKVKQLSSGTLAAAGPATQGRAEDARQIQQLQQERDDLQKKLDAAIKTQFSRKGGENSTHIEELENQVATLRARLEVFEARQVPYTPEELALFQNPPPNLAQPDPKASRKSMKELPSGTVALVADAQRHFARKELDKAEQEYKEVLRKDEKNVYTLGNLAAIELERNELEDAEKHIRQALALSPEDAYALCVLGELRIHQEKYKEALDALSHAAKLEPENAEIQNFLGITLSELGMRGPAETALRKAVELDPGYAGAHHNLAVIYLTQKPPLVELARWHYQKALAAGYPRNPKLEKMLELAAQRID